MAARRAEIPTLIAMLELSQPWNKISASASRIPAELEAMRQFRQIQKEANCKRRVLGIRTE